MSIADWLKAKNEKNRQKLLDQGTRRGIEQGYEMGYRDASEGKPMNPPTQTNGAKPEE